MRNFDDTKVVDAFVNHLKLNGHPNLKIVRRPDKEKVKGDKKQDIDAVAGNFAIEHTSIDTVHNQTRDSARFLKVVKDLEKELSDTLNFRLEIIFPYDGVSRGQNWNGIRESLKAWIINTSHELEDGRYSDLQIPGVPFRVYVFKKSVCKAGLVFSRFSPIDNTFSERLSEQLSRKAKKIRPYKDQGFTTILLVESDDIALMNDDIMLDGIRKAFSKGLPDGVDHVWYANTSIPYDLLFFDFTQSILKNSI